MTAIEKIKEMCSERGWSLCKLSKRSKLSETALYTWKDGVREPSSKSIRKICDAFGVDEFQFYSELNNAKFYGDSDKPHLTTTQADMLCKWMLLAKEEKTVIDDLMNIFIGKKK